MAYTVKNLCCFGGQVESGNPKLWKYNVPVVSGTPDTVTTAGYFPIESGLAAGDIVMAIGSVLTMLVISESSGTLTASAITFAAGNIPS